MVDFKRPAAGIIDLKVDFDETNKNNPQYFKGISQDVTDNTIEKVAALVAVGHLGDVAAGQGRFRSQHQQVRNGQLGRPDDPAHRRVAGVRPPRAGDRGPRATVPGLPLELHPAVPAGRVRDGGVRDGGYNPPPPAVVPVVGFQK